MRFLFLLVAIMMTACVKPYVPPTDGNVATMRFINEGVGEGQANIFQDSEQCRGLQSGERISIKGRYQTRVRAGEPLAFGMIYDIVTTGTYYSWCEVIGTFTPETGKTYETRIIGNAGACVLQTDEVSGTSRIPVDLRFRKSKRLTAFGPNSAWCDRVLFEAADFAGSEVSTSSESETGQARDIPDISGTYRYTIKTDHQFSFRNRFRNGVIRVEQNGSELRFYSDPEMEISAVWSGDTIRFELGDPEGCGCSYVGGEWEVIAEGVLEGTWRRPSGGVRGTWRLQRY